MEGHNIKFYIFNPHLNTRDSIESFLREYCDVGTCHPFSNVSTTTTVSTGITGITGISGGKKF